MNAATRTMTFDGIEIEVVRKAVRRINLRVYPGGTVRLTVPWLMPLSRAEAFVSEKADWLRKTYQRLREEQPRTLPPVSKEQRQELIRYLNERVPFWLDKMQEQPIQIRLRNMKSQWGNCRPLTRTVTFNLQLAHQPLPFREYIIVHELCHLSVPNHSPAFHALVTRYLPDWKERKRMQIK